MQSLQKFFIILIFITIPFLIKADPILTQFMPYYFFDNLSYIETTQEELLITTNADKVFSFDYVVEDEIFASVYATQTQGEAFDHHINVYRRSEGYQLIDVESINVEEYTFLISKYLDNDDKESYVLAFSLEFVNGDLDLHSHWSPNQINTVHRLYNYEIVFSDRDDLLLFIPLMLNKIKDIIDLNQIEENLICPKLYVSKYEYINNNLVFTIHNELGEEWIDITANNLDLEILIDGQLNCTILFPWEAERGTLMGINNSVDYQEDLLFVEAINITSGTIEQELFELEIYPNPTSDFINIKAKGSIQLVDIMGKTIYANPNVKGQVTIDVSALPKKQYFLINSRNSKIETKEVIVI